MKTSPEILLELLNYLKISGNKLAAEIGLNANTAIYHVKNKRNNISPELAKKITERYPEISYNWLLTGEGDMLKDLSEKKVTTAEDPAANYPNATLQSFREEVRADLRSLADGLTKNFEVLSEGMFESLKGQQKILDFIGELDAKEISKATSKLDELLKEKAKE